MAAAVVIASLSNELQYLLAVPAGDPRVTPSAFLTQFQAAAAARNSGKRLPSNAEWQVAALGTPDGAPCNISSPICSARDASTARCSRPP
jgi:hypothetical protein